MRSVRGTIIISIELAAIHFSNCTVHFSDIHICSHPILVTRRPVTAKQTSYQSSYWSSYWSSYFFTKVFFSENLFCQEQPVLSHNKFLVTNTLREKCPYSKLLWSAFSRIRTENGEIRSIQSECGKMRTRITPKIDTFYAVILFLMSYFLR